MKKINNPFDRKENYNCFGCSANNEFGLKMQFWEDGKEIVAIWNPQDRFQGYDNVLHGGIQATLMDEIASWVVFIKLKTAGVTSKMEVQYKRPVYTNKGDITLRAKYISKENNVAKISVKLFNSKNKLSAQADVYYYIFTKEKAKKSMLYPDFEEFFDEKSK